MSLGLAKRGDDCCCRRGPRARVGGPKKRGSDGFDLWDVIVFGIELAKSDVDERRTIVSEGGNRNEGVVAERSKDFFGLCSLGVNVLVIDSLFFCLPLLLVSLGVSSHSNRCTVGFGVARGLFDTLSSCDIENFVCMYTGTGKILSRTGNLTVASSQGSGLRGAGSG